MSRAWVSPEGELHDLTDEELYSFSSQRGLHYENMLDHISRAKSDQKNGGWRLIERLRAIGHVDRPSEHAEFVAIRLLDPLLVACETHVHRLLGS